MQPPRLISILALLQISCADVSEKKDNDRTIKYNWEIPRPSENTEEVDPDREEKNEAPSSIGDHFESHEKGITEEGRRDSEDFVSRNGVQTSIFNLRSSKVIRLSAIQYNHTASDLLGIPIDIANTFIADLKTAGYDNGSSLEVTAQLGRDLRRGAETIAQRIATDDDAYQRLNPCPKDCAEAFVQAFLLKAFRRPPSDGEVSRYQDLYLKGPDLIGSGDPERDGVVLVIEAALQSSEFLYRFEGNDQAPNPYVTASRLSYALWNSMPDDNLLAAAGEGRLDTKEAIRTQILRMIKTRPNRVSDMFRDFHSQWLQWDRYKGLQKTGLPNFANLGPSLVEEAFRFTDYVVFQDRGGVKELLSARYTFANQPLASLYGVEVEGDNFEKVDFTKGDGRSGVLTQIGFLAANSHGESSSPIKRGTFINHNILCRDLPPPPPGVDFQLPKFSDAIKTTRQRVEAHTGAKECKACHSIINPPGYALENYDHIGLFRTTEGEVTIDSTVTMYLDSEERSFKGAEAMMDGIASSSEASRCYVKNLLTYLTGEVPADTSFIDYASQEFNSEDYGIIDLLVDALVTLGDPK